MSGTRQSRDAAPATWTQLVLRPGGRSLIEASAGTGKTWTISVLYLRLLLEERLGAKQVVVATFTDAAAQELRERIRARLLWAERLARAALASGAAPAGGAADDVDWLRARWLDAAGEITDAAVNADLARLRLAQAELDLAPIGTLHGLCRRILADHPFESGSAFVLGTPVPPDAINAELADDLWRRLGQSAGALTSEDRVWWQAGREQLGKHLRLALAPGIGVEAIAIAPIDEIMQAENATALLQWLGDGSQFVRPNSRLRTRIEALAQFIAAGDVCADLPQHLAEVLGEPLDKHLRTSAIAKQSTRAALALATRAAAVLPGVRDALRSGALARYRRELRELRGRRLVERGAMTFDELIERVHDALGDGGQLLADRLFAAWPVALIDEFQDTDALQYAILDRIYRDGDGAQRGRLVMIGDPKQAIYRFRGGDIHAYLAAREAADSRLALEVNFRSSRQYVAALNAFYAHAGATLSSDPHHPIACAPVRDSSRRDAEPYRIDGVACETPLQFHYRDADIPEKTDARITAALEACANHIVALLSGGHTIGAQAVQPGDIAVLLPTGRQIARLRDLLRARAVPCVSTAWSSVFDSDWARELQVILHAALHPRDDGAVRAALATRLGGATYERLHDLRDEPDAWQRETEVFAGLDLLWQSRGPLAVVQQLAAAAAPRLFVGDEGERAMTDLRHLGELLQGRSEEIAGRAELLTWLADERERAGAEVGDAAVDERQLRIESDAARVRLMTLHASKGLEFPIVFLPLMWDNKFNSQDTVAIVHDARSKQRVITFGDDGRHYYRQEGQDERFRLLYVALTRARYACHVYALPPGRPLKANSPRADSDPNRAPLDAMLERLLQAHGPVPSMQHVLWSVGSWPWTKAKHLAVPAARAERSVLAAPPNPQFESTWSFSTLARGADTGSREDDAASDEPGDALLGTAPDDSAGDATPPANEPEAEHAELAWLAPIAGNEFGNAVHAIFEHRSVGQPMAAQHALVERCLLDAGIGRRGIPLDALVPHLAARVQATLDAPLLAHDPTLTLGGLAPVSLRAEMPFEFRIGEVSLRRLREACDFVPPSSLHTLRGLMSGKIDLVFEHAGRFHVLDYKSNRLGAQSRLSAYDPPALVQAMDAHHYRFQALLYTIALDRYLRQRVAGYRRSEHLGEAIYLFVRAVGIAPQSAPRAGIWTQRFDDAAIDGVDSVLAGAARDAA